MFSKSKVTLLMALCLLSIVSIGFSSWNMNKIDAELLGSIHTDTVINSSEYISLDFDRGDIDTENTTVDKIVYKGYSVFKYYEYGFVDEIGYASSTGHIKAYFKLNLSACSALFGKDYDSLDVNVKIGFAPNVKTSLNLFVAESPMTDLGQHKLSASFIEITENLSAIISNNPSMNTQSSSPKFYISNVNFSNILSEYKNGNLPSEVYFGIDYLFTVSIGEYFYQNVFQTLFKDDIDLHDNVFKVSLFVSGTNSSNN